MTTENCRNGMKGESMDNREKRFHERRAARRMRLAEHTTNAERQLEWDDSKRAWSQDVGIAKLMYQALGTATVDWYEDDVRVRFGI